MDNLPLIDLHCHLADEQYTVNEILDIIFNCQKENIILFSMSTNFDDYQINLNYSNYPNVFIGFGIHPYEAHKIIKNNFWQEEIEKIFQTPNPKLKFIGEVGLDLYRIPETQNQQIEVFEFFVYLATKYKLPLSIHSRKAEKEAYYILNKYQKQTPLSAVFHSFTCIDKELINKIIENNWYFGFNGIITFKKSHELQEVIKYIYQAKGNITCETDSPYISPEPYRGKKNYPQNIKIIYEKIKSILNTDKFINQLPIETKAIES